MQHFIRLTSPLNLLATQAQIEHAQRLIAAHRARQPLPARLDDPRRKEYTEHELWEAKYLVDATVHPDTGEPILLPFRMSCFVPTKYATLFFNG